MHQRVAPEALAASCACEGDPARRCSVVIGDWVARAQAAGGTLGPRLRLRDLRQVYADLLVGYAVEQMPDQFSRARRLSSAGTMYQGASGVCVALIMRWYAAV